MWLQAKHLHTSAERGVSPVASLSSPELLSDLFTCSPHATQAKKDEGSKGRGTGEKLRERRRARGGWLWTGEERQRGEKRGNKLERVFGR